MRTLVEVTPVRRTRAFLDAQVACQQQQVGTDETSARALVVDVRVHDREVAKTALHRFPELCPSNQTFEYPLEVVLRRNRQGHVEQVCAMVRLGNMELVLRTWEVGEPSALLNANDVPKPKNMSGDGARCKN